MNQSTINAAVQVLIDRWPFPEGAEEFQRDFVNGLKLAVSDWTGPRVNGFKAAVQAIVADKFRARARPTVDDIVALSREKCGEAPRTQYDKAAPVGPYPGGFFVSPEERKKAGETLRAWREKNRARMAASPVFGPRPAEFTQVEKELGVEYRPAEPDDTLDVIPF